MEQIHRGGSEHVQKVLGQRGGNRLGGLHTVFGEPVDFHELPDGQLPPQLLFLFADVNTGAWYHEAVDYAVRNGLMSGYGNGLFGPSDSITREQLAVMLWRYAGSPAATEKELNFADADKAGA